MNVVLPEDDGPETQTIFGNGTGPRPVFVYATGDGGHHWRLRWHGQ